MQHKILFVSNTANFSKFNLPFMRFFSDRSWQVDYCSLGEEEVKGCNNQFAIPIQRSPFSLKNISAYFKLKKIIKENGYDAVHCHTPMGGVLTRLACFSLRRSRKIKVIYTAHGFHFYKGAPLYSWLFYYPVEKFLSRMTDIVVTINREDYERASRSFKCRVFMIEGVGVDTSRFYPITSSAEKLSLRREKGIGETSFVVLYTAEFIKRKNHRLLFDILPKLKEKVPNLTLVLCGKGKLLDFLKKLASDLGLSSSVIFVGYAHDVEKWCRLSDVFCMPSFQEGLDLVVVESMLCALPVVVSDIRGHDMMVRDLENGFMCNPKSPNEFLRFIELLAKNPALRSEMGRRNAESAKKFSLDIAIEKMGEIYSSLLSDLLSDD